MSTFHRYTSLVYFLNPTASAVPPQEFFELWTSFATDFKVYWKKEQQHIAKEIYEKTKRKLMEEKVTPLVKKPVSLSGLKLRLAAARK